MPVYSFTCQSQANEHLVLVTYFQAETSAESMRDSPHYDTRTEITMEVFTDWAHQYLRLMERLGDCSQGPHHTAETLWGSHARNWKGQTAQMKRMCTQTAFPDRGTPLENALCQNNRDLQELRTITQILKRTTGCRGFHATWRGTTVKLPKPVCFKALVST